MKKLLIQFINLLTRSSTLFFFMAATLAFFGLWFVNIYLDPKEFNWHDVIVESHGVFFDLIVFGFLISIYEALKKKTENIKRFQEEIEDFRGWHQPEVAYRIAGAIKRLNALNVRNINLTNCYLNNARLQDIKLKGAQLHSTLLEGAFLPNSDLREVDFTNAKLGNAQLQHAKLQRANFQGAQLEYTDLTSANLTNAIFRHANLRNAKLVYSHLQNVDFKHANLEGVDLRGSDMTGALLEGAKLAMWNGAHFKVSQNALFC
jgi:uncharacterized protein YjbI with pentapeptide repeats